MAEGPGAEFSEYSVESLTLFIFLLPMTGLPDGVLAKIQTSKKGVDRSGYPAYAWSVQLIHTI